MNGMAHVRGEVAMWRAVIHVALLDAVGFGPSAPSATERRRLRDEARDWFRFAGRDFRTVCDLALLEPEFVREHALRLIEDEGAAVRHMPARRRRLEWRAALKPDVREAAHV